MSRQGACILSLGLYRSIEGAHGLITIQEDLSCAMGKVAGSSRRLRAAIKTLHGPPDPMLECLGLSSGFVPDSDFLPMCTLGGASEQSGT